MRLAFKSGFRLRAQTYASGSDVRVCGLGVRWEQRREGDLQSIVYFMGFPRGRVVKNPPANAGDARDVGLILRLRRSPGVGNGNLL